MSAIRFLGVVFMGVGHAGLTMPSMALGGEFVPRTLLEIVVAAAAGELGSRSRVLWARRRLQFQ
jgi:hypothetical protein